MPKDARVVFCRTILLVVWLAPFHKSLSCFRLICHATLKRSRSNVSVKNDSKNIQKNKEGNTDGRDQPELLLILEFDSEATNYTAVLYFVSHICFMRCVYCAITPVSKCYKIFLKQRFLG